MLNALLQHSNRMPQYGSMEYNEGVSFENVATQEKTKITQSTKSPKSNESRKKKSPKHLLGLRDIHDSNKRPKRSVIT